VLESALGEAEEVAACETGAGHSGPVCSRSAITSRSASSRHFARLFESPCG
jgi:hypothetical protein